MKSTLLILLLLLTLHVYAAPSSAEEQRLTRQEADDLMRKAGEAYQAKQFAEAIDFYRQAAEWGNAWGQNNLAWILATFRREELRNGKDALQYAIKAVEQEPDNPAFVRTLAAAYARNGDFDKAVETQKQMRTLVDGDTTLSAKLKEQIRADHQEKLELYTQGKAFVDPK